MNHKTINHQPETRNCKPSTETQTGGGVLRVALHALPPLGCLLGLALFSFLLVYTHTFIYIYIYIFYIYIYIYIFIYINIYIYINYINIYTYLYSFTDINVCVFFFIYIYILLCVSKPAASPVRAAGTLPHAPGSHLETRVIHKPSSRKFTSQNDVC